MTQKKIKIIAYADIQIETDLNFTDHYRKKEYDAAFRHIEGVIEREQPDFVTILGDIFQRWNPTGEEQSIFSDHLVRLADIGCKVLIMDGNHDEKRTDTIMLLDTGERQQIRTVVEALCRAANNTNIIYLKHSGMYDIDGLTFAVWSHNDKHTCYSPFDSYDEPLNPLTINLYHDPYSGCMEYGEKGVRFEAKPDFHGFHVLAGDIHLPQVIRIDENTNLSYTSSLVIRNFGEGDYWKNAKLDQRGNNCHGYRIVEYEMGDTVTETRNEFVAVPSYTGYHTVDIDGSFKKSDISMLSIIPAYGSNLVKVNIHSNQNGLYQCEHDIITHFTSTYSNVVCRVHLNKDTDKLMVQNVSESGMEQIVTKEGLKGAAKEYIDQVVGANKTLTSEQKADVIRILTDVAFPNIDKLSMMTQRTEVIPLRGVMTNFMAYGSGVEFGFENGIVRIGGSNGFGKTTIFRFINWMWLDIISEHLNANKTKENYQYLFNKHSKLDYVYGEMAQMVDGREILITKRVERVWKATSSKVDKRWLKTDWVKMVDKFLVRYELWIDGVLMFDDADAVRREIEKFVDETMLYTLVCTTQENIDTLLGMDTNSLNAMAMRLAGVDIFEEMADSVEDVKKDEMSKYRNTGRTVGEISLTINTTKDNITRHAETLNGLDTSILAKDIELNELTQQRDAINSQINYTLRDGMLIEADITRNINDSTKADSDIQSVSNYRKTQKELLTVKEAQNIGIDACILSKEKKLSDTSIKIDQANVRSGFEKTNLSNLKEKSSAILVAAESRLNENLSTKRLEVSNKSTELANTNNRLNMIATELRQHVTDITNKYNSDKALLTAEKTAKENRLNLLGIEIGNIERDLGHNATLSSKKQADKVAIQAEIDNVDNYCPECKAILDSSRHSRMIGEVKAISEQITELSNERIILVDSQRAKTAEIEGCNISIAAIEKSISDLTESFTLSMKAENLPQDKVKELTDTQAEIKSLTEEIASGNTDIESEASGINAKALKDAAYMSSLEDISKKHNDILAITKEIETLTQQTIDISNEIGNLKSVSKEISDLKETISKLDSGIVQLEANKATLTAEYASLIAELEASKSNQQLKEQHLMASSLVNKCTSELGQLHTDRVVMLKDIDNYRERLTDLETDLKDTIRYDSAVSAMKIYTTMVGKKGLPAFIFGKVAAILNTHFNTLLKDMYFRVRFNEDNVLVFVNYKDMENPFEMPCAMTSGMEKTFAGLALKDALNTVNIGKKYGFMLIDEITGKLNDGSGVSYNTVNYMEEMVKVLHKIQKNSNICLMLVDHHIKELGENVILETGADEKGFSKITRRTVMNQ